MARVTNSSQNYTDPFLSFFEPYEADDVAFYLNTLAQYAAQYATTSNSLENLTVAEMRTLMDDAAADALALNWAAVAGDLANEGGRGGNNRFTDEEEALLAMGVATNGGSFADRFGDERALFDGLNGNTVTGSVDVIPTADLNNNNVNTIENRIDDNLSAAGFTEGGQGNTIDWFGPRYTLSLQTEEWVWNAPDILTLQSLQSSAAGLFEAMGDIAADVVIKRIADDNGLKSGVVSGGQTMGDLYNSWVVAQGHLEDLAEDLLFDANDLLSGTGSVTVDTIDRDVARALSRLDRDLGDYLPDTSFAEGFSMQITNSPASGPSPITGSNRIVVDLDFGWNLENVGATSASDRYLLGSGGQTIDGLEGRDVLFGYTGDDSISGGADADIIFGGEGEDTLDGGDADDILYGGRQADRITGGDGVDTINGAQGIDAAFGGAGDDVIFGGGAEDILYGDNDRDTMEGGKGVDTLFGGNQGDTISGNSGNDVLRGQGGKDEIRGAGGEDEMFGGKGTDTLYGGENRDQLFGGEDEDTLQGGAAIDTLDGGDAADLIQAGGGNDIIFGGNGRDDIRAGDGRDQITGGVGNDTIAGGKDADDFIFADGHGTDTITDFGIAVGDDIDLSAVTAITSFNDLVNNHMTQDGSDVLITYGTDSIRLLGETLGELTEANFIF